MSTFLPRDAYNTFRGTEDLATIADRFHSSLDAALPQFDAPVSSDSLTNPLGGGSVAAPPPPVAAEPAAPAPPPVAPVVEAPPVPPAISAPLPATPTAPLVAPPSLQQPPTAAPASSSILDDIAARFHQGLDFSLKNGGQAAKPDVSGVLTSKTGTDFPTSSDTLTRPLERGTTDTHQSQFGMGLSADQAYAACGPAAAIGFARQMGRNPTSEEAAQLATSVGWTAGAGMAGVASEQKLLEKMGVATKLEQGDALDWNHITRDASNGNPVILDTPGHYMYVDDARLRADGTMEYHIGTSGTDLVGGKGWESRQELEGHAVTGAVRGALFADSPISPHPSIAGTSDAPPAASTQTTAGLSGGGDLSGRVGAAGQAILSAAGNASSWLGEQGQKALQAVLITEGGLNKARGDSGSSAGPLQFFGEEGGRAGQLNAYAASRNMTLSQARDEIDRDPMAAVQWAIGTPDKPGYLGAAIAAGQKAGLQGADLATYAQQHGQVSVSPERAGQNWQSLFGSGQAAASGGSSDPVTAVVNTLGALKDQAKDQVGTSLDDIASKFHQGLDDVLKNVPDLGAGLKSPTYADSPVAQQAAGQHPSPFAVKDQAVAGLADTLVPPNTPVASGAARALLDPTNLAFGAGGIPMALGAAAGGEGARDVTKAGGGDETAQTVAGLVGSLAGGLSPQAIEKLTPRLMQEAPQVLDALTSLARVKQSGQADVNFAAAGLPGLLEKLGLYSAEDRATLEAFASKQAAAGTEPAKIGDGVRAWMEANPPPAQGVVEQMGSGAQRLREAAKERGPLIAEDPLMFAPVSRTAPLPAVAPVTTGVESTRPRSAPLPAEPESAMQRAMAENRPGTAPASRLAPPEPTAMQRAMADNRPGTAPASVPAPAGAPVARAAQALDTPLAQRIADIKAKGPAAVAQEESRVVLPDVLPASLAKASPRYSIGPNQFQLELASDTDKALFVVAQKVPSKADEQFMVFLRNQFPEASDAEIRQMGTGVRSEIKTVAQAGDPKQGPLQIAASKTVADARAPTAVPPSDGLPAVASSPADAMPEYQRIAQEAVDTVRGKAAARAEEAAKAAAAPPGITFDAEGNQVSGADPALKTSPAPAPAPDWLETAVADQRAAGPKIAAESDLGPAIGQFGDLQTASAKAPPSLGDIAWGVMAEGKKSIFSLSNVHAMNIVRGLTTSPAGPGGAAQFAKAYVAAIVKGVQEHPQVTAAVEAATKDGVQFFAHSPETGGAASGVNPLIVKGAQAALGGVSSAASVYGSSKAAGASDEDALRNAVIAGGIGAIAGPTLAIRMHDALWKDAVPLAKVLSWSAAKEAGLSGPEAAKFANNLNGGQNLAQIAGSDKLVDLARLVVQSPDWLLSQLKLTRDAAIGLGKTVRDPGSLKSLVGGQMTSTAMTGSQQVSRDWLMKQLLVYGFATEALQFGLTGHFTDQNSAGRQFMVEMPTGTSNKSGKSENMTTSLFDGNLQQVLDAAAKHDPGSTIAGKVNPWLATPMELLTNKQYLGGNAPPITAPGETGLAEKWRQAQFVAGKFAPIGVSSPVGEAYAGAPLPAIVASTLTGLPMSHNTGTPGQSAGASSGGSSRSSVRAPARAPARAATRAPARAAPLPARR